MSYESAWFIVVVLLFTGYAVLDGFDFGAGAVHLFLRKEKSRRIALNAIGPVWDGNQVWLVIGGGALFAGFPEAYATLFSAFYVPFMLFLFLLILRAVSIEFRSKEEWPWWRRTWDTVYYTTSIGLAFSLGVVLGNVLQGLPLDADHVYRGSTLDFFNPLALLTGVATLAACVLHGALYLAMKTEGRLFERVVQLIRRAQINWFISFAMLSVYGAVFHPDIGRPFAGVFDADHPASVLGAWVLVLPASAVAAVLAVPAWVRRERYKRAFVASGISIVLLLATVALRMFPVLCESTLDAAGTLTIYNAAASDLGLSYMLTVVAIGGPLVLAYTWFVYRTFRGKVILGKESY